MRFFILLSYRGSGFNGWQKQIGLLSVQEHLENAFSVYLRIKSEITGAGRTDTGVHAINYVAHLDCHDIVACNTLAGNPSLSIYKINAILPSGITVHKIVQVDESRHARFDAVKRTYKYFVNTTKDPLVSDFSFFFPYNLDIEKMNYAASLLCGERDFTSMAKLHSNTVTNICNVYSAEFKVGSPIDRELTDLSKRDIHTHLYFEISANRFLRNMVRAVTGSLLEVGRGIREPDWIQELLQKKNRAFAGNSVPAHALFLTGIDYPYNVFE